MFIVTPHAIPMIIKQNSWLVGRQFGHPTHNANEIT